MDWQKPDTPAVTLLNADPAAMSKNERIKLASAGLYYVGDGKKDPHSFIEEVDELDEENSTISGDAKELSKFFGIYKQQGRTETGKKTDENFFMVRIRCPGGGELNSSQWNALDEASDLYGDGTLRLTSRQAVQYHHVYGPKLAGLMGHLNESYLQDATLSACGDVNRNVMCSPIDGLDPVHHPRGLELANAIAEELAPRSSAYSQIWVSKDESRRSGPTETEEPIYGKQYLPRKFKIGIAHPGDNIADILTQDVGLMPVIQDGVADGSLWDLYTGGGMGLTHNNPGTAALLGLYLGRIRREQVIDAIRAIVILQNENGERKNRKQARWKYTIRRMGLEWAREELRNRFEIALDDSREPEPIPPMNLHSGWNEQRDGSSFYGLSIPAGRVAGTLRKALRKAIQELNLGVRLTGQQDLLLCNVKDRVALEKIFDEFGVVRSNDVSIVKRNAMACPATPTCGLAMTGAEHTLPEYLQALEEAGLGDVDVVIRMTGCPNNCARPPSAEIGIYGHGKNAHTILAGGSREGTRIGKVLFPKVSGEEMIPTLIGILQTLKDQVPKGMGSGDFLNQTDTEELQRWIQERIPRQEL